MKKIRKVDPRLGQSLVSFGCACGTCAAVSSACVFANEAVTSKVNFRHVINRKQGGSLTGGAG